MLFNRTYCYNGNVYVLSSIVATDHMQLVTTCNIASRTEEPFLNLILINLNISKYIWLVAPY